MPRKPKRPCSYPGCPRLVEGQYCEEHKKLTDAQYNKYSRDNFSKSFYKTPEWLFVRKRQLAEHPFCEECLKKGQAVRAVIVDHIRPIKQGGQPFAPSNLQSLCWSCHSRKSAEEGSRWRTSPARADPLGGGGIKSPGLPPHTAGPHSRAKNRIFKNQRGKSTFVGYPTKVGAGKTAAF